MEWSIKNLKMYKIEIYIQSNKNNISNKRLMKAFKPIDFYKWIINIHSIFYDLYELGVTNFWLYSCIFNCEIDKVLREFPIYNLINATKKILIVSLSTHSASKLNLHILLNSFRVS